MVKEKKFLSDDIVKDLNKKSHKNIRKRKYEELDNKSINITSTFLSMSKGNLNKVVEYLGKTIDVSRSFIFHIYDNYNKADEIVEWHKKGLDSHIKLLQNLDLSNCDLVINQLLKGEELVINDTEAFSYESEFIKQFDIKAALFVPIKGENNSIDGFLGVVDNENHRNWSEKDIKIMFFVSKVLNNIWEKNRIEKKYFNVFNNSGNAIVILDDNGIIVEVNREFERLSGYSSNELEKKKSYQEFVHPDDLDRLQNYFKNRRSMDTDIPYKYGFKFLNRNRKVINMLAKVSLVPDTKLRTVSLTDISYIKKIEHRLEHQLKIEETVARISSIFSTSIRVNINNILGILGESLNVEGVMIFNMYDGRVRKVYDWYSYDNETALKMTEIVENCKCPWILKRLKNNENIVINKKEELPFLEKYTKVPYGISKIEFFLAIPIFYSSGTFFGFISIISMENKREWSKYEVKVLEVAAKIFINYLERRESDRKLKLNYKRLENSMDSIVYTISTMLEMKDPYTFTHQQRVAKLASTLGKELGLSPKRIKGLKIIGLLHDIGKIKIPTDILIKPRKKV